MSLIADVPARCPGTNVALADALRIVITWKMFIETQVEYPVSARAWIVERSRCHSAIEVGRPKSGDLVCLLPSPAQLLVGFQGIGGDSRALAGVAYPASTGCGRTYEALFVSARDKATG